MLKTKRARKFIDYFVKYYTSDLEALDNCFWWYIHILIGFTFNLDGWYVCAFPFRSKGMKYYLKSPGTDYLSTAMLVLKD